jgi:hypothetical protein
LEVDPLGGVGEDIELVFVTLTPHDVSATIDEFRANNVSGGDKNASIDLVTTAVS